MESNNSLNKKSNEFEQQKLNPVMPPLQAAYFGLVSIFFLYQIGGGIISLLIFGTDLSKVDINAMRLMTMGGQILLILFPALVFTKLVYEDVTTAIRFRMPDWKIFGLFIGGLVIITPMLQSALNIQNFILSKLASYSVVFAKVKEFFDMMDSFVEKTYADLLSTNSVFEVIFVLFMVSVVPAICEEIFFRGYVQTSFELRYKKFTAALITGLFFGLYHFSPYGLIGLLTLGLYFGIAAYVSNSIFVPVVLHFLNNLTAVSMYLIWGSDELSANITPSNDEVLLHIISFIVLLVFTIFFVNYIMKYSLKKKMR